MSDTTWQPSIDAFVTVEFEDGEQYTVARSVISNNLMADNPPRPFGHVPDAPKFRLEPTARTSDPETSHLAARSIAPTNGPLVDTIRALIGRYGPMTQEEVASSVAAQYPGRWREGSVVSACARANLKGVYETKNSRGRAVIVWALDD